MQLSRIRNCVPLLIIGVCFAGFACEHSVQLAPVEPETQIRLAFANPADCASCHPNHFAEWQASTHAYAFTDPIFFRLNEIGQQRSNQQLEQFCIKCHSPVARLLGEAPAGFDQAGLSSLSKQAVQCDVCHRLTTIDRGNGPTDFRLDDVRQGPISKPATNDFHASEFDLRYSFSDICTPCHDVFSPSNVQVEFTSREWDRSPYSAMGLECQGCHMPAYRGQAAVGGPERTVHRHSFTGVDVPLVDFPGRAETIRQVEQLLKNAIELSVKAPQQISTGEPFDITALVTNSRAGHDIPTGTAFERQMWIEIRLTDLSSGMEIFSSGTLDGNGDLKNKHSEEVQAGFVPADSLLGLFNSVARKNGQDILFFWEADEVQSHAIGAFATDSTRYPVPAIAAPTRLELQVSLRFRAFAPYFLRAIDLPHLIDQVPIFEMASYRQEITVN